MFITRKNLAPLEAKLRKKKDKNSELKSLVRSLKDKVKGKNEEIISFIEQIKGLEEDKAATTSALDATLSNLHRLKVRLEQSRVYVNCLSFMERKARLYPLKKKKIY